jgi:hypothetical protein
MGLLYGGTLPSPGMDWLKAPGCTFIQNRTFENDLGWITSARAAGTEVLWYVNVVEYPIAWNPVGEEGQLYGGYGNWNNVPDSWWWSGSKASASSRSEYSGHYMLNIRPNSPWWNHVLTYVEAFWSRWNGYFDGWFLDVLGYRLWASVWNTMWATTDAFAGDGRKEAANWIRGVHWGISQLRDVMGPEAIIVANNIFDITGTGGTDVDQISGGYPSMQKGGHPALNGNMFEGAEGGATTGQHPVSKVMATVNGQSTGSSPNGYEWATLANGRKRFQIISSKPPAQSAIAAYTNVPYASIGAMPNGYLSNSQIQVSGTTKTAIDDHYSNWLWDPDGGSTPPPPPPDPTVPDPPTAPPHWFGNRLIGANKSSGMTADYIRGTRYLGDPDLAGLLAEAVILLDGLGGGTGSQVLRAILAADASGNPGSIVATSSQVSVASGANPLWIPFSFSGESIQPGTSYWLFLHSGATGGIARYYFSIQDGVQRLGPDTYSDGAADPVVAASVGQALMSAYIRFTPPSTETDQLSGKSYSSTQTRGRLTNSSAVIIPSSEVIIENIPVTVQSSTRRFRRKTSVLGVYGPEVRYDTNLQAFVQIEE